ncbi:MAG: ParB/RepB/Spo0J family partition protein [Chloroflexota bacterium]
MARRKINLQNTAQKKPDQEIKRLVQDMGTTDLGFAPTDQVVYEVDLSRIKPDHSQSRHVLPHDLWEQLADGSSTPAKIMQELIDRADRHDQIALLILGGQVKLSTPQPSDEDDENSLDEERGLLFLANSIQAIGLRQPINLYSIPNSDNPAEPYYQVGEGERRYWAHHLLVAQGQAEFVKIRAVIEELPTDQDIIQRRQEAENAARQDLSGIARARSIKRMRNRLSLELGTRVPGQTTIKLPSQRTLDVAVGKEVKSFTGRAISDRMVRNYLALLKLSPSLQDLAEAAQLTEKQLRPVPRLETEAEQRQMISDIIREKMSGQAVLDKVQSKLPGSSLKMTRPTTLEQRLEKRLFQTVKTVHEVVSLGQETYTEIVQMLAERMQDTSTKEALIELRQVINDLIGDSEAETSSFERRLAIQMIKPPIDVVRSLLPQDQQALLDQEASTGLELWQLFQTWQQDDPILGSHLYRFF